MHTLLEGEIVHQCTENMAAHLTRGVRFLIPAGTCLWAHYANNWYFLTIVTTLYEKGLYSCKFWNKVISYLCERLHIFTEYGWNFWLSKFDFNLLNFPLIAKSWGTVKNINKKGVLKNHLKYRNNLQQKLKTFLYKFSAWIIKFDDQCPSL